MTSVRKGFAGGGFEGGKSLPKRMAVAAGVEGADLIPDTAELFLGFTSTQRQALGPPRIVNFETLGHVDLRESGYFRGGTHMHLSHLFENVEAWYLDFDFAERVDTAFPRPRLPVEAGTQTVSQGPDDVVGGAEVEQDFRRHGAIGHAASMQPVTRLQEDVEGADGTLYPKGTAIPQRADFNTLDNPFFWSSRPDRDGMRDEPSPGIHFVVFNPSSDDFHRGRLAMDGVLPGGTELPSRHVPADRESTRSSTTHRQNFLVPPGGTDRSRSASCPFESRPGVWPPAMAGQPKKARATSYHSRGTRFSSAVASASETSTIASPWRAAMRPKRPSSTSSAALSP